MADLGSFNKVVLIGRIVGEIKSKNSSKGTPIASFTLATNEIYLNEDKPRPSFHRIICFGKKAGLMVQYGEKARLVAVEGKLHARNWEDDQGQKHTFVEVAAEQIVFLGPSKKKEKSQEKDPDIVEEEGEDHQETGRQPGEDDPFEKS